MTTNQIIVSTGIGLILLLMLMIIPVQAFAQTNQRSCNCVVFRFDDIQDYWIPDGQLEPLKIFNEKNASVTLGLVGNSFGDDFDIVNETKTGYQKGLYEIALHGWNHVSYANLSLAEQTSTIGNGTALIQQIYGMRPTVFIPPFNDFNDNTLQALTTNNISILSAEPGSGGIPEQIFSAKRGAPVETLNDSGIYAMPQTVNFNDHLGGEVIKIEVDEIVFEVNKAITTQGYGVVVLHPTDFVDSSESGQIEEGELQDLERLIEIFKNDGRSIVSFQDVANFPK